MNRSQLVQRSGGGCGWDYGPTRRAASHALRRFATALVPFSLGAVLVAMLVAGCAGQSAPNPSDDRRQPPSVPAAQSPPPSRDVVAYPRVSDLPTGSRARAHFREITLTGSWTVEDYTDNTCTLRRVCPDRYPYETMYLLDPSAGQPLPARRLPVEHRRRFHILSQRVSDRWLVWEEVAPGDDLIRPVDWRIYAARIHSPGLRLGDPILVDAAHGSSSSRPLLDLHGNRLTWAVATPDNRFSCLSATDLEHDRLLYSRRIAGIITSLTSQEGRTWATVLQYGAYPSASLQVFAAARGTRLSVMGFGNRTPLSHWVARHDGWVCWALFPSRQASRASLYARDPQGLVHLLSDRANDPGFVGDRLIFRQTLAPTRQHPDGVSRLIVMDLRERRLRLLLQGDVGAGADWLLPTNRNPTRRTLISYTAGCWLRAGPVTRIRIYDLQMPQDRRTEASRRRGVVSSAGPR